MVKSSGNLTALLPGPQERQRAAVARPAFQNAGTLKTLYIKTHPGLALLHRHPGHGTPKSHCTGGRRAGAKRSPAPSPPQPDHCPHRSPQRLQASPAEPRSRPGCPHSPSVPRALLRDTPGPGSAEATTGSH